MAKTPKRVAVTGAAGQIGYSLLFRIANGDMLGKDQPVILQLLEIDNEKAQKALKGVMMELEDCAFPLLAGMSAHSDPMTAFKDVDVALLVGARPRCRHRCRRSNRLCPVVPYRVRRNARQGPAGHPATARDPRREGQIGRAHV